jgi:hypothetical protein
MQCQSLRLVSGEVLEEACVIVTESKEESHRIHLRTKFKVAERRTGLGVSDLPRSIYERHDGT